MPLTYTPPGPHRVATWQVLSPAAHCGSVLLSGEGETPVPDLIPFQFHTTTVSAITDDHGQPWFVAADVCKVLGLPNVSQAIDRLKSTEKSDISLNDVAGRLNKALIITESGFYKLVMRSRKKIAEEFQCWVTEEVLPQIRKTGTYTQSPAPPPTPAQAAVAIAQAVLAVEQRTTVLEATSREQAATLVTQGHQLAEVLARHPPPGKSRLTDWLMRDNKPRLTDKDLKRLRALCRSRSASCSSWTKPVGARAFPPCRRGGDGCSGASTRA